MSKSVSKPSGSATRRMHDLAERQGIADVIESTDPFRRRRSEPHEPDNLTEDQRARERAYRLASRLITANLVSNALAQSCRNHNADRGEFCWPAAHGICPLRIKRGDDFRSSGHAPMWSPRVTITPLRSIVVEKRQHHRGVRL